jgi:hypothetical protein
MDLSALDKAISALQNQISGIEHGVDRLEKFLWIATVVVAIGVALELYSLVHEYRADRSTWARGIIATPEKPSRRVLVIDVIAVLLVVAGIVGELAVGILSANKNEQLRGKNRELIRLVEQKATAATIQAGDAKSSAEAAALAADRAKTSADKATIAASGALTTARVAKREGQKAYDTAHAIVEALRQPTLTEDDQTVIADAAKSCATPNMPMADIPVTVVAGIASSLGIPIWKALKKGGFKRVQLQLREEAWFGVSINGPGELGAISSCLDGALLKPKKFAMMGVVGMQLPKGSPIVMSVGETPMGKLPK